MLDYQDPQPERARRLSARAALPEDDAIDFGSNQDALASLGESPPQETAGVSCNYQRILHDTTVFRLDGGAAVDTRNVFLEGEITREATPPEGGERTRPVGGSVLEYLRGNTGIFGWVDGADAEPVSSEVVGEQDAVSDASTEGQGSISAEDQGDLVLLSQSTPVYASDLSTLIADGRRGEAVIPLGEQRKAGGSTFASVRLLSGEEGWVSAGVLSNSGALGQDAIDTSGTWTSGYAMNTGVNPTVLTGDAGEGRTDRADAEVGSVYADAQGEGGIASFDLAKGAAVDVICAGGSPVVRQAAGKDLVYVRASSAEDGNRCGWVPASSISPLEGVEQTEVGLLDELRTLCPNGITVCFVAQYQEVPGEGRQQFSTFLSEATAFAQQSNAVAVAAGRVVTGAVNLISGSNDILATLNSLQGALRDEDGKVPAWARVNQLAIFAHGGWTGLSTGMDAGGEDSFKGDLYDNAQGGNLEGFARTLSAFVSGDVAVSFFACRTGGDADDGGAYDEEGRGGEGGFAEQMQDYLREAGVDDASVMGHFSSGPTVRNPDIRIFGGGSEDGTEQGGRNVFATFLDGMAAWLAGPLKQLQTSLGLEPEAAQAFAAGELYRWYYKTVLGDTLLAARMGTDPDAAVVELRTRAIAWVQDQLASWGIVEEKTGYTLTRSMYCRALRKGKIAYLNQQLEAGLAVQAVSAEGAVARKMEDDHWYLSVTFEGAPAGEVVIIPVDWLKKLGGETAAA